MSEHITALDTLTPWELEQVRFFQGYGVPTSWFVGVRDDTGVEVVALGDGFIWSIALFESEDRVSTSEAHTTPEGWSTGIEV